MSRPLRRFALSLAATAVVAACSPAGVPPIRQPRRIEAFCQNLKRARPTAIASNMTSTNDAIAGYPSAARVRRETSAGDGAIAYWDEQLLALPKTSAALGERDGYARVRAVAVAPEKPGAEHRSIFLDVRDHGTYRWIEMEAFDLEDVCVEGKPQT